MAGYRLTPQARDGLHHIARWVERTFGAAEAVRVLRRLEAAFAQLGEHPEIGTTART